MPLKDRPLYLFFGLCQNCDLTLPKLGGQALKLLNKINSLLKQVFVDVDLGFGS